MRFPRHQVADQKFIDLIPVANVVLLLIFFFLLTWSFVQQPGIPVKLPFSSYQSASQQGRHVITLKSFNREEVLIFFDEKSVDLNGLKQHLTIAAQEGRGSWLTLNADESVPHGTVQQVIGQMMEMGFNVNIATQRSANSTPTVP